MSDFDWNDAPLDGTALLPEQFSPNRRKYDDPIQRLMFAVLDDAIRRYQNNLAVPRPQTRYLLAEAKEWLFRAPRSGPFHSKASVTFWTSTRAGYARRLCDGVIRRRQLISLGLLRDALRQFVRSGPSEHGFLGRREAVASPCEPPSDPRRLTKLLERRVPSLRPDETDRK